MSWVTAAAYGSAVVAVCITVGVLIHRIRKGAVDGVRADTAEKGIEHARDALAIREDVARLSDDELARELRGDK